MQVEGHFKKLRKSFPDARFLTQGVESLRNYLNHVEACYEGKMRETAPLLRRFLTRKAGEESQTR